jgi:hypothetical protein
MLASGLNVLGDWFFYPTCDARASGFVFAAFAGLIEASLNEAWRNSINRLKKALSELMISDLTPKHQ